MANAICFRCGAGKRAWASKCRKCAFDPQGDVEAMAKSYILSVERYDAGNDPAERMSLHEFDGGALDGIGKRIRSGEPFEFDPEEVRQVVTVLRSVQQANWKDAMKAFWGVMWWLAPLWIVITIGLILLLWCQESG